MRSTKYAFVQRLPGAVVAALLLILLSPVLGAAAGLGLWQRQPRHGLGGALFDHWSLQLGRCPAWLQHSGMVYWPVLWNIVRGDMHWVGPRALTPEQACAAAELPQRQAVAPGVMCLWSLRQHARIDYGTEWQADAEYVQQRGWSQDVSIVLRHLWQVCWLGRRQRGNAPDADVLQVGEVSMRNWSMEQALDYLVDKVASNGAPLQVCFVNPACVNIAAKDRRYRRVLRHHSLVLPDGIGMKLAGDILGTPLRQNVNGTDLVPRLCERLAAQGAGVFLLGGEPGISQMVARHMAKHYPGLRVCGHQHGFFDAQDPQACQGVAQAVRDSGADLLLVAMGVPLQEQFIANYLNDFGVRVAMGVGGLFDFVSGKTPRAPVWLREMGGEWLYRLWQEPRRMWRRYLVGNMVFLSRVLWQRFGFKRHMHLVERAKAESACPTPVPGGAKRCVLFVTEAAPTEFPCASGMPAALLPVGPQTVLEHAMARLAQVGCQQVDLIVCDGPERIREVAGDGARWGMSVRMHLVSSAVHPYGVIKALKTEEPNARWVLGHAATLPTEQVLRTLFEDAPQLLMVDDQGDAPVWSGWCCLGPHTLSLEPRFMDRGDLFQAWSPQVPLAIVDRHLVWRTETIADWSAAQNQWLAALADLGAPSTYKPMPWGGHGAGCVLGRNALLNGPVLLGQGCMVHANAQLGPNVVLGDNVVIGANSRLQNVTVLSNTYVGAGLDLADMVIGPAQIYSFRWQVSLSPSAADRLIAPLKPAKSSGRWTRLLAGGIALVFAPLGLLHGCLSAVGVVPRAWSLLPVAIGMAAGPASQPVLGQVRVLRAGHGKFWRGVLSLLAGMLDIAGGNRQWVGARPRTVQELALLPKEWQDILMSKPPGWLNAPLSSQTLEDWGMREESPDAHELLAAVDLCCLQSQQKNSIAHLMRAHLWMR